MFSAYARSSLSPRASAIRSASCATGIASGSARTMWKRAKLASTNAFDRDGGASVYELGRAPVARRALDRVLRASARDPRGSTPPLPLVSRSPAASKWASADSRASAPPCSARQYSALPCRKSRSARSSSSDGQLDCPAVKAGGRLERVQRGRTIARFTQREPSAIDRVQGRDLPSPRQARGRQESDGRDHLGEVVGPLGERLDPLGCAPVLLSSRRGAESGRTRRPERGGGGTRTPSRLRPMDRRWRRTNSLRSSERSVSSIEPCSPSASSAPGQKTLPTTAASWMSAFSSGLRQVEPRRDQALDASPATARSSIDPRSSSMRAYCSA